MNEKLLLMDGHSILNRAFYGVPELTNSAGVHTNAVYGFLNIMFKMLEEEKPTHMAVAFDLKHPTFRHERYKEYKGTRKPMPAELHEQVPLIKELLRAMGIKTVELKGYEADDILGTLAVRAQQQDMQVTVITGDRDLLQLATDRILIRIPKTKKGTTEVEDYFAKDVIERYQVTPQEFIEVKALMGDTADNIPGVPSVGEKTATSLVVQYHSVENLYAHLEEITRKKLKEALENNRELAFLSRELAVICTEAPVITKVEETALGNIYTQEALEQIKRFEFKSMIKRFTQNSSGQDGDGASLKVAPVLVEDFDEADTIFAKAGKQKTIGLEILGSADSVSYEIAAVVLAFSEKEIYVIRKQFFLNDSYLSDKVKSLLSSKTVRKAVCDLKQILKFMGQTTIEAEGAFDCGIAAYLLNPLKDAYRYEDIARDYLEMLLPSRQELLGKMTDAEAVEAVLEGKDVFLQYAAFSALIPLMSSEILKERLVQTGQWQLYETVEMPLVYALDRMEKAGILVERQELANYGARLGEKIAVLEQQIYAEVGEKFNIQSPKQLGEILFVKMQIKGGKKTKTGYSTSAEVLEKLAPDYPFVKTILEYRQLTKLKSTYADGLAVYIGEDDRIHGSFHQTITATGRISSTEPNLQNIPIRMEIGKELRQVFVPQEGCVFIDADYSQIELRLLAHMSGDENLIEAYKSAQDIHRMTAAKVFGTPFEEVTEEQRRNAKAVNFGIVYGISSFGLSQDLSISRKQAAEYIEQYFATYPKIKAFLEELVAKGKENGYVTTLSGRRRPIPELSSSNFMTRSFGERIAMNSPIQGTAADIIKLAMIGVDRELQARKLRARIVLQVHDELLLEVPEEETEEVKALVADKMKHVMELKVALEVGIGVGKNWLEAH